MSDEIPQSAPIPSAHAANITNILQAIAMHTPNSDMRDLVHALAGEFAIIFKAYNDMHEQSSRIAQLLFLLKHDLENIVNTSNDRIVDRVHTMANHIQGLELRVGELTELLMLVHPDVGTINQLNSL